MYGDPGTVDELCRHLLHAGRRTCSCAEKITRTLIIGNGINPSQKRSVRRAMEPVVGLMILLVLSACGSDTRSSADAPTQPSQSSGNSSIAAVSINTTSDTMAAGDSVRIGATASSVTGGTISGVQLTWSSSDTTVARIDTTGMIRSVGTGPFTITVTASAKGSTATAQATKSMFARRTIAAIVLTRAAGSDTIAMADTVRVNAVVHDGLGAVFPGVQLSWTVSDTAAASVDASGLVTARAMGPVTVTATVVGPTNALLRPVSAATTVAVRLAFTRIDAGTVHTCGIARGGSVYCWGEGAWGRLGDGSPYPAWTAISHPVRVLSRDTFTAISLDEQQDSRSGHTCGVTADRGLDCWGSGSWGMLGDGLDGQGIPPHSTAIPIRVGSGVFVDVALGAEDTCALTASGVAYCAGGNYFKQLGVDTVPNVCIQPQVPNNYGESCSDTFIQVSGSMTFSRIYASGYTTCGLTSVGAAWCWGGNISGEAGVGTYTAVPTPTQVQGGVTFTTLAGGSSVMCGLTAAGTAYCWGHGGFGAVGTGLQTNTLTPVRVATLLSFTQIAAGGDHVCALTSAGDAYCWGTNTDGELGSVTAESCSGNATYSLPCSTRPAQVQGVPKFIGIAAGANHTCGLVADGSVYCWGADDRGQLGNGSTVASSIAAVRVKDTK